MFILNPNDYSTDALVRAAERAHHISTDVRGITQRRWLLPLLVMLTDVTAAVARRLDRANRGW